MSFMRPRGMLQKVPGYKIKNQNKMSESKESDLNVLADTVDADAPNQTPVTASDTTESADEDSFEVTKATLNQRYPDLDADEIVCVAIQAKCSISQAVDVLRVHGNVVDAILEMTE